MKVVDNQRVTVSIPYFRCKPYIRKAVESILRQTYRNLILIVVNDGDSAPPWGQLSQIDDPRLVRFELATNRGRYFADQVVLRATNDAYFLIQDADDWSDPRRISVLLKKIREESSDGAVSASHRWNCYNGRIRYRGKEEYLTLRRHLTAQYQHRGPHSGLFKVASLKRIGGYYGGFHIGYDTFLINLLHMTGRISYLNLPLYNRTVRPESLSNCPATGMRSKFRNEVREQLQMMYSEAFAWYGEFSKGDITLTELSAKLCGMCKRNISPEDNALLRREVKRLRILLQRSQPEREVFSGNGQTTESKAAS